MESGTARQRQRFTSVPTQVKIRWIMSGEQLGIFEAWYIYKAKQGAEWVSMSLSNGLGFTENQVRFVDQPRSSILSDSVWEVTADLEVREFATLTEEQLDAILGLDTDRFFALQQRFHTFVHTSLGQTLSRST